MEDKAPPLWQIVLGTLLFAIFMYFFTVLAFLI